jgi:hypothetical protein
MDWVKDTLARLTEKLHVRVRAQGRTPRAAKALRQK